ncbi:MoxR family ATPase [Chamaesiphon sp. OTE_20_metabat_361]|uniref:AAA family ATPase n=1 Tax=Chamaesiphon sp. OTE_20_metabat_361 TaxID=2964689 RepID=UPI00286C47D0|nr:MoxR family ATPase [Chamaesiphon sp. OTE_20_metabat_361]
MTETHAIFQQLSSTLQEVVFGQEQTTNQLLIALLTGGHVILEGVPGTGKTMMAKVLSQLIQADFRRIQLTPDILPADILGTNIFDLKNQEFILKKGPVFTQILLADEINRTPPKTQSALLEAMAEGQVTLDGDTLPLSDLFWTIATQNSLEFEGTYPLPEAQLDRFLFKLIVDYPPADAERELLATARMSTPGARSNLQPLKPVATIADCLAARRAVQQVTVNDNAIDYLLALVQQTRQHPDLSLGASPRAAIAWLHASKSAAWLDRRQMVIPDDFKQVALPLLRHRLVLRPEAQLDGLEIDTVIAGLVDRVPVPR